MANAVYNRGKYLLTKYRHEDGTAIPVRIEAFPLPGGSVLGLVTRL